jgi:hypothetical protein
MAVGCAAAFLALFAWYRLTALPPYRLPWRAGNGTRTRDPNLGKVVLYQLSYSRVALRKSSRSTPWRRGGSNP